MRQAATIYTPIPCLIDVQIGCNLQLSRGDVVAAVVHDAQYNTQHGRLPHQKLQSRSDITTLLAL
jgi:hypothetical protein